MAIGFYAVEQDAEEEDTETDTTNRNLTDALEMVDFFQGEVRSGPVSMVCSEHTTAVTIRIPTSEALNDIFTT